MKAPQLKQPTWRTPAVLSAFLLNAWGYDTLLGHGGASPWGWLMAFVLVAGISALSVYGAKLHPLPDDEPEPVMVPARPGADDAPRPRPAAESDFTLLPDIERSADTLFEVAGYGVVPPPCTVEELEAADAVIVVGEPPVGFARIDVLDGEPHLEQLSVHPRSMKRGVGSALLAAVDAWVASNGYRTITLRTFADVPWNGPYYGRRGWIEVPDEALTPALARLRDIEIGQGMPTMGRRIAMRKSLDSGRP